MSSGGSGDWRSRGRREAMPKPVSQTWPVAELTRILLGLTSLWMRPRACNWRSAADKATANLRNFPTSMGAPRRRSIGSPPGSLSTSMVCPRSRTSANGRTAHASSNSSFSPYSCIRRLRVAGVGCPAAGTTAKTARQSPSVASCLPLQKTRSPSFHDTSKLLFRPTPDQEDGFICWTRSPLGGEDVKLAPPQTLGKPSLLPGL
jgi:hypothetical protein